MERTTGRGAESRQQPEILQRLEDAVAAIQTSEDFRRWLDVSARFHHYSLGNQLLIAMQRPEATQVAGFQTWRKVGRQVRRGEKGIAILVPHARLVESEDGETSRRVTGFGTGHVFDIIQTDGEPLPEHNVPVLEGDAGEALWEGLVSFAATEGGGGLRAGPSGTAARGHGLLRASGETRGHRRA